jgi:hypothetical protein
VVPGRVVGVVTEWPADSPGFVVLLVVPGGHRPVSFPSDHGADPLARNLVVVQSQKSTGRRSTGRSHSAHLWTTSLDISRNGILLVDVERQLRCDRKAKFSIDINNKDGVRKEGRMTTKERDE